MAIPPAGSNDTAKAPGQRLAAVALLIVIIAAAGLVLSRSGLFNKSDSAALPSSANTMTQAEIEGLLDDWVYPHAKYTTTSLRLPPKLGSVQNPWPKYIRRFVVAKPAAMVRRFYALKLGVNPNSYVASSSTGGVVPSHVTTFANALQAATALPSSPREANGGNFTYNTKNYMIEAMISGPDKRRTQVVLLLVPLPPGDSYASAQSALQ